MLVWVKLLSDTGIGTITADVVQDIGIHGVLKNIIPNEALKMMVRFIIFIRCFEGGNIQYVLSNLNEPV